jgi:hypothetical protein
MQIEKEIKITKEFLDSHPNVIFVFGDNLNRMGIGGAAMLRNHNQSYGFITKKVPTNELSSFYKPKEYQEVFHQEVNKLKEFIKDNPKKLFLISKIGAGLADKFFIFETIIRKQLPKELEYFKNVVLLWN